MNITLYLSETATNTALIAKIPLITLIMTEILSGRAQENTDISAGKNNIIFIDSKVEE